MSNIKQQAIEAFQASAPGHCWQTVEQITAVDKFEWNIEALPSGGTVAVVLCPKSRGKWRLFGIGLVNGATQAEAVKYAKQVITGRDVYAYNPGPCEYQTILSQLPIEVRSFP